MNHDPIAMMQAMIDHPESGDGAPPFVRKLGFDQSIVFKHVAVGEFDLEWQVEPELCHYDGFVQGGVVVVVADVGQSFAFWSTSKEEEAYSTGDFHTRYLRPIAAGNLMRVENRVTNRSRRTAAIESRFLNSESGKLHAIVSGGWVLTNRDFG